MHRRTDIKEAAALLNISEQRVRTLCRSGTLKAKKYGLSWSILLSSIEKHGIRTARTIAEDHKAYNIAKKPKKPIALSFFSGAMGMDLGLEKAGFDIRLACEIDKYCRQTIELNRPDTALLGDINNCTANDIRVRACLKKKEAIDLVTGGPPCQAFSTAGKRKGFNDDRGNVFLKFIDLALELNPKYIVIENVRGLLSCPLEHRPHNERGKNFPDLGSDQIKGGALNFILSKLKLSNYSYSFNLYDAANFGTPQNRERVVLICSKDGKTPPFLEPIRSRNGEHNLPSWETFKSVVKGIKKHDHLSFPEKRLKYYRVLKAGQNWRNLPIEMQKDAMGKSFYSGGGKTGFFRRLGWDKPSPTLLTHPAMPATDLAHPKEDRPLSIQEYKRVQDFPDSWELAGPLMQQYKQVGNAVAVNFGQAIGRLVIKLIRKENVKTFPGFKYSRYKNTSTHDWEQDFAKRLTQLKKITRSD